MEDSAAGDGGCRASRIAALGMYMPSEKGRRGNRLAIRFPRTPFHSLLTLLAMTKTEMAPATQNP